MSNISFFKNFYIKLSITSNKRKYVKVYYPNDFMNELYNQLIVGTNIPESLFGMYLSKLFKSGSFNVVTNGREYEAILYPLNKQCTRITDLESCNQFYEELYTYLEMLHAVTF